MFTIRRRAAGRDRDRRVELQTFRVFDTMRADLQRVDERVGDAAALHYPIASQVVGEIVRAGGKRLRPLVLLLAGRAYDYDRDALVTAAAGVELLHTASLVHDDMVDRAALRRGKPTLNSVLSSGAVILIGDYLFAQSAVLAAATQNPRVVAVFAATLADICDGELREIFDAHRLDQTREEYERRIFGKTASLFAGAAEMGAIIARAPEAHTEELRAFGRDIGLAFQIMDDVLDLRAGTGQLGKPAGQDLRQGTVTLPTMLYAAQLPPDSAELALLRAVVAGDASDEASLDAVIAGIRVSGALDDAVAIATSHLERAKARLAIVPDRETRALLGEVADFALTRAS